ncbi:glycogen synthase kinase-3 beta [Drosophila obscura]|uniref:glycogen synthase kinase-3 beta n=1 Tax=Drosophila obscura TaxID=7282 RepID=UPI001BB13AB2|nr:glycogen synthase kinase-3 beta [Drosophila obscura]
MEGHQCPVVIPIDSELKVLPVAQPGNDTELTTIKIRKSIGHGAFGRVYIGTINQSRTAMAIKQTCMDTSISYREPEIMLRLQGHCNIRRLHMHSIVPMGDPSKDYILLVMDYLPMTLTQFIRHSLQHSPSMDLIYIRIISYQLFRGLAYLHSMGYLPSRHQARESDDQRPLTYICSRFYRAPELYANCQFYGSAVDIWSAGCVLAELFKGKPLFNSVYHNQQQLRWIVHILGPSGLQHAPEIRAMWGCTYNATSMHTRHSWDKILGRAVPPDLAEVLNCCLVYDPNARIYPLYACAHACYDELRNMEFLDIKMPNGYDLPPLFNFSNYELQIHPELLVQLLPLCLYNKYKPAEPNTVIGTFTKYFPVKPKNGTTT